MMDLCRLKQVGYVPIPCHFILRNLDMASGDLNIPGDHACMTSKSHMHGLTLCPTSHRAETRSLKLKHGTADPRNYTELHVAQLNSPHCISYMAARGGNQLHALP